MKLSALPCIRPNVLVVLKNLLAHEAGLLGQGTQRAGYGIHRPVLFLNHHLERKRVMSDQNHEAENEYQCTCCSSRAHAPWWSSAAGPRSG